MLSLSPQGTTNRATTDQRSNSVTFKVNMANDESSPIDMVLIMGITGAGKSYLINRLQEGAVVEGRGLESSEWTRIQIN